MVFVSIGTQKQNFSRLFHLIEESKILDSKNIVAQAGYTEYSSSKIQTYKFLDHELYLDYIKQAEFVICHGGVGTIFDALYNKKKILAVPRLQKYGEHVNDHQIEICEELEKSGYLVYLKEYEPFDDALKRLIEMKFKEYIPNEKYLNILKKEI